MSLPKPLSARCWLPPLALAMLMLAAPAHAHPHVYITVAGTIAFEQGKVAGFEHVWFFDELYTAMAVEGLDKNGDGKYDREELAELAKVNIEGLKEFGYFTQFAAGGKASRILDPKDYWLEHKDGVLSLHFMARLETPIAADAKDITIQVADPSFFIAFEMAKKDPVRLGANAPAGCKVDAGVPPAEQAEADKLTDAFKSGLGGDVPAFGIAKTITLSCPGK